MILESASPEFFPVNNVAGPDTAGPGRSGGMERKLPILSVVAILSCITDARSSKKPLKEASCETEFMYSVSQLFRRVAESDEFLQVNCEGILVGSCPDIVHTKNIRIISKSRQSYSDPRKLGFLSR